MEKTEKTTKIVATTLLILVLIAVLTPTGLAAKAQSRIWGRFGWISPAAYDKPWYGCRIEVFVAPEISNGKVSATFTAGGKTYQAGPASVSGGTVLSGGKYKGWRKIDLYETSTTGTPNLSSLRIVLHD